MNKKLYRSATDKRIAGVCGGIGAYFNVDSTLIRLAFALFVLLGGSGVLLYIIAALIIPLEPENPQGPGAGQQGYYGQPANDTPYTDVNN